MQDHMEAHMDWEPSSLKNKSMDRIDQSHMARKHCQT